ncbi:unnamed protein product [Cylindrotheca closterium]|uniref:Uncharacterized protein n=1 Tax=Cylindrotheca closterium TaxID=2856 RepID=A0AAD2FSD7_9STRA|nr:unnamed protein product [Cylindrotheca closterium]
MNQKLRKGSWNLRAAKGQGGREPTKDKDKDKEGDSTRKKCSQCESRTLHTALKLEHNKTVCPLAGHAGSCAKVAAEQVATAVFLANKERLVGDIIKEVSDNWPKKSQAGGETGNHRRCHTCGILWSYIPEGPLGLHWGQIRRGGQKAVYFGDNHSEGTAKRPSTLGTMHTSHIKPKEAVTHHPNCHLRSTPTTTTHTCESNINLICYI